MREIKFRAWEKNLKEMIPVYDVDFANKLLNTKVLWRFLDEIELMQYTGLNDKNGREIFEGDIIFIHDDEVNSGWWENVFFHEGAFFAGDDNLLSNVHFRAEVAGNKYEGPLEEAE